MTCFSAIPVGGKWRVTRAEKIIQKEDRREKLRAKLEKVTTTWNQQWYKWRGSILPAKRLSFHQRIHRAVPVTLLRDVIDSNSVYTPPAPRSSVHKPVPAFCSRRFLWEGAAFAGWGGASGPPHPAPTRWGGGKPVLEPAYPGSGRGGPRRGSQEAVKTPGIWLAYPRASLPAPRLFCLPYWWGPLRIDPNPAPRPAHARAHTHTHTHTHTHLQAHPHTHPLRGVSSRCPSFSEGAQ